MTVSAAVLDSFGLAGGKLTRFESGLINKSWRVDTPAGESFVLQWINPMFPATINHDIDVVTRHLRDKGMRTPLIVPTRDGEPALVVSDDVWRVLTFVPGVSREKLENARQALEASALLGQFHRTVSDLEHKFSNTRLGVHDTNAHMANLKRVCKSHSDHPQFARVEPIAERILDLAGQLPGLPLTNERIVHGDPKISNFIFDSDTDDAVCLVDLDTMASMPVVLELGDAFRSWCNPRGEDTRKTTFSVPLFRAALNGYARGARDLLSEDEWRALPSATLTIALELAARFAADALQENYFGWDSTRYETASEHNQVRAAGQLRVADSVRVEWQALTEAVNDTMGMSH